MAPADCNAYNILIEKFSYHFYASVMLLRVTQRSALPVYNSPAHVNKFRALKFARTRGSTIWRRI